jgi:phage portal protein BeeE
MFRAVGEGLGAVVRRWWSGRPSESDLEGRLAYEQTSRELGTGDYRSIPAVGRARSMIVSLVGELEPVAWRGGFPLPEPPEGPGQPAIVRRPQPGSTRDAFLGSIAGELFDHSNAYLWIPETGRNSAGFPDTAVVMPFERVSVSWDESRLFRRYFDNERSLWLTPGRDLVHVELPGRRPEELLVPSKFDANADALDRILAAEFYAEDWFSNGAVPSVTLKFAGVLNAKDANAAKAQWVENHRDHSPGVLGQGWDLTETGGNPESSQLLETRARGVLEVARIWGIVPAELLLAELGGSSLTYQNVAAMLDTFMRVTGQPEYLSPIEAALSDLVPATQAVRFDLGELFRLAESERVRVEAEAIGAGILTLPEVRRGRGLPVESAPRVPPELAPTPPAPEEVGANA